MKERQGESRLKVWVEVWGGGGCGGGVVGGWCCGGRGRTAGGKEGKARRRAVEPSTTL